MHQVQETGLAHAADGLNAARDAYLGFGGTSSSADFALSVARESAEWCG